MNRTRLPAGVLALVLATGAAAQAPRDEKRPANALEVLERSQAAFYYAGADMKARVTMELVAGAGKKRTRVLTMLRKNDSAGKRQKYFLFFHEPGDVRRTAFLVFKHPEKDDDRWVFVPAMSMVRRVAASDSRSSFVGSDFTYEDVSGRDLSADTHALLREEKLDGTDCFVVQSVPNAGAEYTKKLAWIDGRTFLPLREEYYDARGALARVFTADKVEPVLGSDGKTWPTVSVRTMKQVQSGHATVVRFEGVAYGVGLDDTLFTERALQDPPQRWTR